MTHLIELFYGGPHQIVPVVVGLILWIGLAGIGYLITGRDRIVEANVFFGWAGISTLFTLVGIFIPGSFLVLSVICAVAALAGIALALKRGESLFVPGSWRVFVLALPLLIIAGAMDPSQWDEFSHWLPAARFLTETDGFPTVDRTFGGFPSYPYGWPLLMYLAARIAGGFLNNVSSQLNLLMLCTISVFALRTAFAAAGKPRDMAMSWPFAAAAALVATGLNPIFVQKIVLTAYSDIASAVVTGMAILVGFVVLERMRSADARPLRGSVWQLALVLALLINIRPPNIEVLGSVLLGMGLIAWRDPGVGLARLVRFLPLLVLPAAVTYLLWRGYVATELAGVVGAEESLRPLSQWNFSVLPQIVMAMAGVALKKIAFFGPMLAACIVAVMALIRCRTPLDRIAILTATVFAVNIGFLLIIYLGHFGAGSAATVVSFWRYNIDVGTTAMIFASAGVIWLWRKRGSFDSYPRWLAPVSIALVLILPCALVTKLRFDFEPPKPHYIAVAKSLAPQSAVLGRVYVVDPKGSGEAAVITRYYLNHPVTGWLSAFSGPTPQVIAAYLDLVKPGDHVLVHSTWDGMDEIFGQTLDERTSYLFKREPGEWHLVRVWAKPADHPY